jgi:hypothetical protein
MHKTSASSLSETARRIFCAAACCCAALAPAAPASAQTAAPAASAPANPRTQLKVYSTLGPDNIAPYKQAFEAANPDIS